MLTILLLLAVALIIGIAGWRAVALFGLSLASIVGVLALMLVAILMFARLALAVSAGFTAALFVRGALQESGEFWLQRLASLAVGILVAKAVMSMTRIRWL